MPEPITIIDAIDGDPHFRFTRINHDLVEIAMLEYGTWLIASPQYTRWLINFILDNPRAIGRSANGYEFSPEPGNLDIDTIPLYITHDDIARLKAWLEAE